MHWGSTRKRISPSQPYGRGLFRRLDFSGGQTRINEGGRGEIVNLPNGTQIIPHDVSKKTATKNGRSIVLYFIIQGNVIGNKAFMEQCGDYVVQRIVTAEDRV